MFFFKPKWRTWSTFLKVAFFRRHPHTSWGFSPIIIANCDNSSQNGKDPVLNLFISRRIIGSCSDKVSTPPSLRRFDAFGPALSLPPPPTSSSFSFSVRSFSFWASFSASRYWLYTIHWQYNLLGIRIGMSVLCKSFMLIILQISFQTSPLLVSQPVMY